MARICCTLVFLMMVSSVYCFNCPDESETVYYADASVDCMVYHLCNNSEVTTFMCPFGLAFDNNARKCKDSSVVHCVNSDEEETFDFDSTTKKGTSNKIDKNVLISHLKERLSQEGFLFIGKYFSTKANSSYNSDAKANPVKQFDFKYIHSKSKRSVESYQSAMQDLLFQYKFTNFLILPLVSEIMQDSHSKADLQSIFLSARYAYMPIYYKVHHRSKSSALQLPQKDIDKATKDFFTETGPLATKIVDKHLFQILQRLSRNVPLVLEMIDRLDVSSRYQVEKWKSITILFFRRHGEDVRSSSSEEGTSNGDAVRRGFRIIENLFVQFFSNIVEQSPGSVMKLIYDRNSVMYRSIMGETFLI